MKKYLVIAALMVASLVGLALLLLGGDSRPAAPAATPTPSPAATATPAVSSAVLEQYSSEFGTAYFNYSKIDNPKYLDSIRPFLAKDLYAEIVADNRRAGSRAPALSSEVLSVETAGREQDSAHVSLRLRSREAGGAPFEQVFTLDWVKRGDRWTITQFTLESTTRKHPYLEE